MRKTPINTATVDQASRDLKREPSINAWIMAETTDATLGALKTAGDCNLSAATQRAMPNAKRIADAAHRPLLICQVDSNLTIALGEIKP